MSPPASGETPACAQAQRMFCDVLIVGAGPAGLSAAQAAATGGGVVLVLDDNPHEGGQIWRRGVHAGLPSAAIALQQAVRSCANVRILNSARVVGILEPHCMMAETDAGALHLHWKKLILCTGARERLLPFPGWTLPGVSGAGGLQALIKGGLPVQGQRLVIAGSGPLLFAVAATARKAGARVLMVAETVSLARVSSFARKLPMWPSKLVQALQLRDASYRTSTTVLSVAGTDAVQQVSLRQGDRKLTLDCDRVAVGYGLVPNSGLAEALGCGLRVEAGLSSIAVDGQQQTRVAGIYAAGECTGIGGCELAQVQGSIAGYAAVGAYDKAHTLQKDRAYWSAFAAHVNACFALDAGLKKLPQADTIVCRCEDVRHGTLQAYSDWTQAKIHSRCGMGACQGKVCASAAQFLYGWETPPARLPFMPARIGTLACSVEAEPSDAPLS